MTGVTMMRPADVIAVSLGKLRAHPDNLAQVAEVPHLTETHVLAGLHEPDHLLKITTSVIVSDFVMADPVIQDQVAQTTVDYAYNVVRDRAMSHRFSPHQHLDQWDDFLSNIGLSHDVYVDLGFPPKANLDDGWISHIILMDAQDKIGEISRELEVHNASLSLYPDEAEKAKSRDLRTMLDRWTGASNRAASEVHLGVAANIAALSTITTAFVHSDAVNDIEQTFVVQENCIDPNLVCNFDLVESRVEPLVVTLLSTAEWYPPTLLLFSHGVPVVIRDDGFVDIPGIARKQVEGEVSRTGIAFIHDGDDWRA